MKIKKIDLKRVNINLPTILIEKVKKYSIYYGISVTSAYSYLLSKGLLFEEMEKKFFIGEKDV